MRLFSRVSLFIDIFLIHSILLTACRAQETIQEQEVRMSTKETTPSHEIPKPNPSEEIIVREPALAGSWYSSDEHVLRSSIEDYLNIDAHQPINSRNVQAIVVPHAGHRYSGQTAAAAYRILNKDHVKRVFILSPNHRVATKNAVVDRSTHFKTPLGTIPVDRELIRSWLEAGIVVEDTHVHAREHAIEIQLPFLQVTLASGFTIVPIIIGQISEPKAQKLAKALRNALHSEDLLIISTDLVHYGAAYGFVPFDKDITQNLYNYDHDTLAAIKPLNSEIFRKDMLKRPHSACGSMALWVMTMVFEEQGSRVEKLAYTTSGAITGDDSMSVSYMAMYVSGQGFPLKPKALTMQNGIYSLLNAEEQAQAIRLAWLAVKSCVLQQNKIPFDNNLVLTNNISLSKTFLEHYGVFVTLKKNGELRGCIGNIIPQTDLAHGIWGLAQAAALQDPRFNPVREGELEDLSLDISVLSPPKAVSSYEEIELGKHGIILRKHGAAAVFLPQVAPEQGWDLPQTLTALSRKAGLSSTAWKEGAQFDVFEAQVIEE